MSTFELIYRAKWMFDECTSINEMVERLDERKKHLLAMQEDGIVLRGESHDDYPFLETKDPKVAEKWGFCKNEYEYGEEEDEGWNGDELEDDDEWEDEETEVDEG